MRHPGVFCGGSIGTRAAGLTVFPAGRNVLFAPRGAGRRKAAGPRGTHTECFWFGPRFERGSMVWSPRDGMRNTAGSGGRPVGELLDVVLPRPVLSGRGGCCPEGLFWSSVVGFKIFGS